MSFLTYKTVIYHVYNFRLKHFLVLRFLFKFNYDFGLESICQSKKCFQGGGQYLDFFHL